MDCEKFESTMIDELYGELDELTSAAAKRHVSGCARCASMLSGLRATRELAVLPVIEPPAGLEERILAAAREAQKVVPIRSRASRVVSWAGRWAMRPQTAMAALFLLMIGSSALLLRGRAQKSEGVAMRVTQAGAPAPQQEVPSERLDSLDSKQASKAHGAPGRHADTPAPAASAAVAVDPSTVSATTTPTVTATATIAAAPQAGAPHAGAGGFGLGGAAAKPSDRDEGDLFKGGLALAEEKEASRGNASSGPSGPVPKRPQAVTPATPAPPPAARPRAAANTGEDLAFADAAKDKTAKKEDRSGGSSDGEAAGNAYRARNYGEAARLYDEMAKRGDKHAALQAARSVREQSGCSGAVSRFDALSASAWGTDVGYDATLEAGYCYNVLGNADLARARFSRLLTVASHAQRAQNGLTSLNAVAARKAAAPAKAAPQATQAPAGTRPAEPQTQSKPSTDTASGF